MAVWAGKGGTSHPRNRPHNRREVCCLVGLTRFVEDGGAVSRVNVMVAAVDVFVAEGATRGACCRMLRLRAHVPAHASVRYTQYDETLQGTFTCSHQSPQRMKPCICVCGNGGREDGRCTERCMAQTTWEVGRRRSVPDQLMETIRG